LHLASRRAQVDQRESEEPLVHRGRIVRTKGSDAGPTREQHEGVEVVHRQSGPDVQLSLSWRSSIVCEEPFDLAVDRRRDESEEALLAGAEIDPLKTGALVIPTHRTMLLLGFAGRCDLGAYGVAHPLIVRVCFRFVGVRHVSGA
jgi:hypothetical protein